jgi:signal transduction histidine kinase/CHASE3 domain sensor protein
VSLRRQFTWLVLMLVVGGAARFLAGHYTVAAYEVDISRIRLAQQANQGVLQLLTDAETGIRGFQLTGDRAFLEPYERGVAAYPRQFRDALTASNPQARRLLAEQESAAAAWLGTFARPVTGAPPGASRVDVALNARGKRLFDEIRTRNAAVATRLGIDEEVAADEFRFVINLTQGAIALLSLMCVLIALVVAGRTSRLLLSPLSHLQTVLHRLAGGERSARATVAGPPEVRDLARTLNSSLDATDRAEAQLRGARDAVERQNTYFLQVLDSLNMAVVACDGRGDIVFRNRVARAANPAEDLHHVGELTAVEERDDDRHPLARALAGEVLVQREMTQRRPGLPDIAVMVDACPVTGPDGTVIGAVASGYDVSVLRDREAELAAFAGVVAHDLKSPLASVLGYTEMLADELDAGDVDISGIGVRFGRVTAAVTRMGQLIDDLLAYATARDKPLVFEPVNLHAMVTSVVADRVTGLGADGRVAPMIRIGALPTVSADAVMIRQLLDNVVGNALKYSRPGEPPHVQISAHTTVDDVQVQIDDRGIGIPADQRGRIFTAFHRAPTDRPYPGTGLGLAICERVTQRHGGSIAATDNPDGGTRITITLPRAAPPARSASSDSSLAAMSR